jgi:hypothetical protein
LFSGKCFGIAFQSKQYSFCFLLLIAQNFKFLSTQKHFFKKNRNLFSPSKEDKKKRLLFEEFLFYKMNCKKEEEKKRAKRICHSAGLSLHFVFKVTGRKEEEEEKRRKRRKKVF